MSARYTIPKDWWLICIQQGKWEGLFDLHLATLFNRFNINKSFYFIQNEQLVWKYWTEPWNLLWNKQLQIIILLKIIMSSSTERAFSSHDTAGYVGFANLPNQVHRKSVKKGFEFTLMVVGESGLGKSTLINSLFLTDLYPGNLQ